MGVRVRVRLLGEREFREVPLEGGGRLRDLLAEVERRQPGGGLREGAYVIVNNQVTVGDRLLADGDEVVIMPLLVGG